MKKYIVVFNESASKYAGNQNEVYEYLKSFEHWAKLNQSSYIVVSDLKPSEIRDTILEITNHYGEVYVMELNEKYSVFGPDFVTSIFNE